MFNSRIGQIGQNTINRNVVYFLFLFFYYYLSCVCIQTCAFTWGFLSQNSVRNNGSISEFCVKTGLVVCHFVCSVGIRKGELIC